MKILIVTEDLPVPALGGAGKHAVLLGNALLDAGHHVEILGRQREPGVDTDNGFRGRIHADIDLRGTGWKEHTIGAFLPWRRVHLAKRVWAAIKALGQSWDVIHYHGHFPALGALIPADVNFVHTIHDQGSECLTRIRFKEGQPCTETSPKACAQCASVGLPNMLQQRLSAFAVSHHRRVSVKAFSRHKVIFVSAFLQRRFAEISARHAQGSVVHNFVDANLLEDALEMPVMSDSLRPTLFLAGRIDSGKGFGEFLDMLPDSIIQKFKITIAGDGPELKAIRARHAQRGIEFLGWQPQLSVLSHAANADVFIQTSTCEEACSTTVLEALALNRRVLALHRGGTPELVRYQSYPGQLSLYHTLDQLVNALHEYEFRLPVSQVRVNKSADVNLRIPEVLAVYRAAPSCSRRLA